MKKLAFALPCALFLFGCSPELNVEDAAKMLEKGTIGGVNLGDSWTTVKQKADPDFKVDERPGITQLRRDLGSSTGDNAIILSVNLDGQQRVTGIRLTVSGTGGNTSRVEKIETRLRAYFSERAKGGGCTDKDCRWDYSSASNGRCSLHMNQGGTSDRRSLNASLMCE